MDPWEVLYRKAKAQLYTDEISPFFYTRREACALETSTGKIFTGVSMEGCCSVLNLCAERAAAVNMYLNSGEAVVRRLLVMRKEGLFLPCGVCREFFMQLNIQNARMEILTNLEPRRSVILDQLMFGTSGFNHLAPRRFHQS